MWGQRLLFQRPQKGQNKGKAIVVLGLISLHVPIRWGCQCLVQTQIPILWPIGILDHIWIDVVVHVNDNATVPIKSTIPMLINGKINLRGEIMKSIAICKSWKIFREINANSFRAALCTFFREINSLTRFVIFWQKLRQIK